MSGEQGGAAQGDDQSEDELFHNEDSFRGWRLGANICGSRGKGKFQVPMGVKRSFGDNCVPPPDVGNEGIWEEDNAECPISN